MYCGTAKSATGDHVFPRKLFLERHRAYLPQVPACASCSGAKSKIETDLTAILPFGGRHETARENLELQVPKRLRRNRKLATALVQGVGRKWSKHGDLLIPTMTLSVDPVQVTNFVKLVVRGLVWHHWQQILTSDHFVKVMNVTDHGEQLFNTSVFDLVARDRVEADFGEGSVIYQGAQGTDCPQVTAWKIAIYGGMRFTDESGETDGSRLFVALTGPKAA